MKETIRKTKTPHEIVVGSHILLPMKKALQARGIRVERTVTAGKLLRQRYDDIDRLTRELNDTFRNCPVNVGNACIISAYAEPSDMRMLAHGIAVETEQYPQRTPAEDANLIKEEGLL